MKPKPHIDDEESISQDSLTSCIAALKKSLGATAAKFSFAPEVFERPQQDLARVENAARLSKARERHSREKCRSLLNLLTNSQIEKWIAGSPDAELRSFFKAFWREDAKPPRKAAAIREYTSIAAAVTPAGKHTLSVPGSKESQVS
jgi:hypothetical protein